MTTGPAIAAILGVLLGLLMLLAGLGSVIDPAGRARALREIATSSAMQMLAGLLAFTLGAAVMILVPLNSDLFSIIITVLGWAMVLKGGLLLLWGEGYASLASQIGARAIPVAGWALTLLGAVLFVTSLGVLREQTEAVDAPFAPISPMAPVAPNP